MSVRFAHQRIDLPLDARSRAARAAAWVLWITVLAGVTLVLIGVRPQLDKAYVMLAYLLVVLGGSAHRGRLLGLVLSALAFLAFNLCFVPPFGTLAVANPFDWLAPLAFLTTSTVATQLLARAQHETAVARRLTQEVDRLAALGAETINAARADDALASIAAIIRDTVHVRQCAVRVCEDTRAPVITVTTLADLAAWVGASGRPAAVRQDGTTFIPPDGDTEPEANARVLTANDLAALYLPLRVHDRTVGVLHLADERGIVLDPVRRRVLGALTYYAALGAERVRLERTADQAEALREADRMKDAVLASVSHDLRTPLTTIKALAHAMAKSGDERAFVIIEESDRLTRLVTDLLDLSRLQGGALRINAELVAVDDLVGAAIQRLSGVTGHERLHVVLDDTAGPLLVGRFDFVHTLRVLVNLVENALKYAPSDSVVELTVLRDAHEIVFNVADRGPGVPADERARIFDAFYRRLGAEPDVGGTGLGLSIARGLAEAQGGSLAVADREGGGSVFSLRLPAADIAAGALGA